MAKSTKQQIDQAIKKISNLNDKLFSSANMNELAEKLLDQIKKRTRVAAKGVDDSGNLEKFPALSEKYVDFRKANKENLGDGATIKKSNVSATGQMLNSMEYEAGKFKILFRLAGTRRKELSGGKSKNTNAEVAGHLLDRYEKGLPGGRQFFKLSKIDDKTVKRFFSEKLKELLDANKGASQ